MHFIYEFIFKIIFKNLCEKQTYRTDSLLPSIGTPHKCSQWSELAEGSWDSVQGSHVGGKNIATWIILHLGVCFSAKL